MSDCLFCKIVNKEIAAEIIYENEVAISFKDIKPVAPIHLLIVPKKHIPSINQLTTEDTALVGELFLVAQKLAKKYEVDKDGYRLVFNVGKNAGQTVNHLHLHLIGGQKLMWA